MNQLLTSNDLANTTKNLKALIDGHLEDTGGIDERWFGSATETAHEGREVPA